MGLTLKQSQFPAIHLINSYPCLCKLLVR